MSELIAIAYPDEATARRAHANLAAAVEKGQVEVEDVVVIGYDDAGGFVPIMRGWEVIPAAFGGAVGGGLIGLALLGMVAGATVAGRAVAKRQKKGIQPEFVHELWQNLPPGHVAVIVLVREVALEKFPEGFRESGLLIHTTLGDDVEAELAAALEAAARR
jgi:uncharacterized membrane protein